MLRMVTTPIKNFLSRAKTCLSSSLSVLPLYRMSLNCHGILRLQESKLPSVLPSRMSLNCQDTSGCMTLNCPLLHSALSVNPSRAYGPHDCLTTRTDSDVELSLQNTCPDLDPSSSTDSLQTHDSLVTPESPHLPSPIESLEEGTTEGSTQVGTNDQSTAQVRTNAQVRTDSLAYDSLVTALSRLSLEPDPDPLSDPIIAPHHPPL